MADRPLRLLVVDDNPADRDLVRAQLAEAGLRCTIEEAATRTEATERVRAMKPDCLLLDMNLPEGRAADLLEELSQVSWPMGIIVITGQARDGDAADAIREGAQDYVIKGHLDSAMLAMVVRNAVQRARLAHERAEALASLERADRRKDEFMAMLGHELRNPLAAIRTAVEVAEQEDPAARSSAVAIIRRQTQNLARLVDDLLEASRVSRGRITLRREPVRLDEAITLAVEVAGPMMDKMGHSLELRIAEEPLEVYGDPVRIEQLLVNLLTNAAKYTEDGGSIEVTLERTGGHARITVRDDGVGMDAETLADVFEPFVQASRTLDRSEGGLGLGLALVRQIARLHGGNVEAESDGIGRGAAFRVRFPLHTERAALSVPPESVEAAAPTGEQIVLVEDNEDAAELLSVLLRRWGFEVAVARDGEDGLAKVDELRPAIVLLDIGLPRINGYELAKRIRANPEHEGIRLFAISGYGAPEDRERSQEAGFDDHLVKPVDPEVLRELLTP